MVSFRSVSITSHFRRKWHGRLHRQVAQRTWYLYQNQTVDFWLKAMFWMSISTTEGSISKGSILRLPEYLHYYFTDLGYKTIVFFDSMQGFYNTCEPCHVESFARITNTRTDGNAVRSDFKGKSNSATSIVRAAVGQNQEPTAIIMNLASRYITSPVILISLKWIALPICSSLLWKGKM